MKEKRIGPDTILNVVSGISVLIWIIFASVFILFAVSNPTYSGRAAARPGLQDAGKWVNNFIYGLLIMQIMLSIPGLIFNMMRMKRKTDHVRLTLIFSTFFGVLCLILIIFN